MSRESGCQDALFFVGAPFAVVAAVPELILWMTVRILPHVIAPGTFPEPNINISEAAVVTGLAATLNLYTLYFGPRLAARIIFNHSILHPKN